MCGNTNRADLELLAGHGVDFAGIIVGVPWSARSVEPERAGELFLDCPLPPVLVVVDPSWSGLQEWVLAWRPAAVQLHGHEPPELVEWLVALGRGEVWKVLSLPPAVEGARPEVAAEVLARAEESARAGVHRFLLDTAAGRQAGGTGRVSNWELAGELVARLRRPALLAGGLDASNVTNAVRTVRPAGVDVAGGVEATKGRKDPARVAAFLAAVRGPL
jgi:phosphoribosylanthranilate isomerase